MISMSRRAADMILSPKIPYARDSDISFYIAANIVFLFSPITFSIFSEMIDTSLSQ